MSETTKKERLVTPVGEAKWAHVHVPKQPFEAKGEAKYQIDVCFDKDSPEWAKWATALMERLRAIPTQTDRAGRVMEHQPPIKQELDSDDKPTGRFYTTFKTGEKFKPAVFDKFGQPVPETSLVGNGSKVRVNYTPSEYKGFGGGIALYLNAVQVLELVEFKPQTASAFGFGVEPAPTVPMFPTGDPSGPCDANGIPQPQLPSDDDKVPF